MDHANELPHLRKTITLTCMCLRSIFLLLLLYVIKGAQETVELTLDLVKVYFEQIITKHFM